MKLTPDNEQERLKALQNYNLLDTLPESEFDRITELASIICNTPIALVSLIDANRQWFKSKVGLDADETARDISFCQHAILDVNLFQVENALEDERFKNNPLVTGNPNIRFYAGYPLRDPNGYNLGTLCVINQETQKLTSQQERALQLLAEEVMGNILKRQLKSEIDNLYSQKIIHEEELKKISSMLKEAEKVTKMGAWELDLSTNLTVWTDEVYAIHEVEKGFDHNKVNGIEFYHPDYRQKITDAITNSIVNQVPFDVECKFISAKGNHKWVRSTGHPIIEDGKVVKLFGAFLDITQAIEQRQKLEDEKLSFESIIEGTNVGTWEWNVQTGETIFNEKWANIIGYTLEEISPVSIDTWMKFAHPDDLAESGNQLNSHFEGKLDYYNFESRMKHKNGHWVWVLDRGKVVTWTNDGKPLMMFGTHQDITHAKELELELKQKNDNLLASEEEIRANLEEQITLKESLYKSNNLLNLKQTQLDSILTNLDDYIYSVSLPDEKTIFIGPNSFEVYGVTQKEWERDSSIWMERIYGEDRYLIPQMYNDLEKKGHFEFEYRVIHPNGQVKWVKNSAKVVFVNNEPIRLDGVISDINEQKTLALKEEYQHNLIEKLFEFSPVGLSLNDFETGQFIQVNKSLLNTLNYTLEEFLNLTYFDLTPEKYLEEEQKMLESLKNTGKYGPFEKEFISKEGKLINVLLNGVLVKDIEGKDKIWSVIQDITLRKQKDLQIQKSLENLNNSQSLARLGSWEFNLDNHDLYWSNANFDLFEIDPNTSSKNLFQVFRGCISASELEMLDSLVNDAVINQNSYEFEHDIVTPKGTKKRIFGKGKYVEENGQKFLRGTAQDISHNFKQRELNQLVIRLNKVLLLKDDFRVVYDQILQSLLKIMDSEYGFIGEVFQDENNQPYLKTYALTNIAWDDATKRFYDEHAPNGLEFRNLDTLFGYALKNNEIVISNNPSEDTRRGGLPKGHPPLNAFLGVPIIFNGILKGMIGIANKKGGYNTQDVEFLQPFIANFSMALHANKNEVRRQNSEKLLLHSKQQLESIFNEMTDGVWSINANDFSLNFISPSMVDIYGYELEEWKKDTQLWAKLIFDEDKLFADKIWEDIDKYGEFDVEYRIVTKSGEIKWVRNKGKKVNAKNGNIRIDGATSDITKEKNYVEELAKAKKQAEKANQSKSMFISNMSHEIRTPLTGVIGFTNLLQKTPLNETQKLYVNNLEQSSKLLFAIVNDVLDFSKIEAGKMQLEEEFNDIQLFISDAVDMVLFNANKNKTEVFVDVDPLLPRILKFDVVRLGQILINLLSNAVKFTNEGSVILKVSKIEESNNIINLNWQVIDNGVGISEEKLQSIFESFSQEDVSTTRKFGGTGLGLTIANKLLELMGENKLSVSSQLGKGSVFSFTTSLQISDSFETKSLPIKDVLFLDTTKQAIYVQKMFNELNVSSSIINDTKFFVSGLNNCSNETIVLINIDCVNDNELNEIIDWRKNNKSSIKFVVATNDLNEFDKLSNWQKKFQDKVCRNPITLTKIEACLGLESSKDIVNIEDKNNDNRILVVDDNPINILLATKLIQQYYPQAKVSSAKSGKEAIELYKNEDFDLILMDVHMPEMNGYETTHALRFLKPNASTKIVALTASDTIEEREECINHKMDGYLTKPIKEKDFLAIVSAK